MANKWKKFADTQGDKSQDESAPTTSAEALLEQETDLGIEFPDREQLERKLTEMEQVADEYKDKNLRLAAQMKNLQERAEREISRAHKFGIEKLLADLLPVLDSLVHGLETGNNAENNAQSMLQGMQLTLDLFINTLKKHGLEVIAPAPGEAFNPEIHEAMSMQADAAATSNTILQVLQQGYSLHGRVLRAARVVVAK